MSSVTSHRPWPTAYERESPVGRGSLQGEALTAADPIVRTDYDCDRDPPCADDPSCAARTGVRATTPHQQSITSPERT